jgi:hypothetical protein
MKKTDTPHYSLLEGLQKRFFKEAEAILDLAANSRPRRKLNYTQEDFDALKKNEVLPMLATEVDHPLADAEYRDEYWAGEFPSNVDRHSTIDDSRTAFRKFKNL